MKKKREIDDFTNFGPEFAEEYGQKEYPTEITLRNYGDDVAQRKRNLKDMEDEQKREENGEMKTESKKLKHLLRFNETFKKI